MSHPRRTAVEKKSARLKSKKSFGRADRIELIINLFVFCLSDLGRYHPRPSLKCLWFGFIVSLGNLRRLGKIVTIAKLLNFLNFTKFFIYSQQNLSSECCRCGTSCDILRWAVLGRTAHSEMGGMCRRCCAITANYSLLFTSVTTLPSNKQIVLLA